jgi:Transcription factor WhiB
LTAAAADTGHVVESDWRHRAACRDVDPEVFFPVAEQGPEYEAQVNGAKAVCAACPVWAACLVWALDALPYGVAGGLSETERRQERVHRRRAPGRTYRVLERPVSGSRDEIAAAGRAAIESGHRPQDVARAFGVALRTAQRWASSSGTTAGRPGGNRASHLISQQHSNPLTGTRAAEGNRA